MRRATIVDVAREAGVSKSTVSLVLQGSPLVRAETRAAVEEAMRALGYVYNRAAAALRGAGVGLIGIVINDLRNPFFAEFAASAQTAFAARGYATVIAGTDEDAGVQAQVIGSMVGHGVAGLLVSPAYGDEAPFEPLRRAGVPAMQVLRQADPHTGLFPFASLDYAGGGRLATQHLIGCGARRIAFVGGLADRPVTVERMAGWRGVLEAAGLPAEAIHGRPSRAFGRDTALRLAAERPEIDAALCFNDLVALGMLSGFAEAGVTVGRDVRLVGCDDIEEAALSWPGLSSVRCDVAGFARDTAGALLDWLEQGRCPPTERRAPVALVARRSSLGR